MATGFMEKSNTADGRNSNPRRPLAALALIAALGAPAQALAATEVVLVGLIGARAIVAINGGAPRALAVGQKTAEGVVLLATEKDSAQFEIDGARKTLRMGQAYVQAGGTEKKSVTLKADARGHFMTVGTINGGSVKFLVDTGATLIALPASDAKRLGINYQKGQRGTVQTANGVAVAYRVKLDSVRIGDVEVSNVDAAVGENDAMGVALLGMSFLNRMEMKRDGDSMTLTKRF
jgi:aspartyl protease family protein